MGVSLYEGAITMDAAWICDTIKEGIARHGKPEIINSDQGSQFTSDEYTELRDVCFFLHITP